VNRFAALLDRLAYEPRRNAKIALVRDYLATTPDPERGWALAAMTGGLVFRNAKAGMIRALAAERVDPVLFALSYDYVGDLSETVALIWPRPAMDQGDSLPSPLRGGAGGGGVQPAPLDDTGGVSAPDRDAMSPHPQPLPARGRGGRPSPNRIEIDQGERPSTDPHDIGAVALPALPGHNRPPPDAITLTDVIATLRDAPKAELPRHLARWLDSLDETGRWALLKLVTGALRIGVSARLAKTAVAGLATPALDPDAIEEVWHGLAAPYGELFAWVEGRGPRPETRDPAPFRPPMLAHPLEEDDFDGIEPGVFVAEYKWDGIRVQAAAGTRADGRRVARLHSRTGEEIGQAFPDLLARLSFDGAIDGELLIIREGRVEPFAVLQQRLNRKTVTPKTIAEFPAAIRAYDLLAEGAEDLRALPFVERRRRLEAFVQRLGDPAIHVSPLVPFESFEALAAARAAPGGPDAAAVEGLMLKRADSPYVPGRPKGLWWKWKREPRLIDAVLMYAQRGHGKRSSFYSDYTFGVWTREGALSPVGKAYFGFTDEELKKIDRFVRDNTTNRFGPVREVTHTADAGLVIEVAFEGLQRSTRHKSGVAMRFPRISRLRWDKRPKDADTLETLERMLPR
jgi:DNA ligase-1